MDQAVSGGKAVITSMFEGTGALAPPAGGSPGTPVVQGGMPSFHAAMPQDRLVAKEVSLGAIREYEPPEEHIGLRLFAPFQDVESDDVIFDYTQGLVSGLAPARAEDAESELAQKDETVGYGRASIIDWALKDHYRPSDVSRYRESLLLSQSVSGSFPLTIGRMTEEFASKIARDERLRRKKLDNRLEWLIMESLANGQIVYNDGKIVFTVSWGRPAGQETVAGTLWDQAESDPIGNTMDIKQAAKDTYGVTIDRMLCSERVLNRIMSTNKWNSALGGNPHPFYTVEGWGIEAAINRFRNATDVTPIVYDAVYRTRPIGGTTITNNRFFPDNKVLFLPSQSDIDSLDDTVGFGATLTSPHPEGNWTSGFYEWERDTVDPWSHDRGTGIKGFPVFPHLELTYTLDVLA